MNKFLILLQLILLSNNSALFGISPEQLLIKREIEILREENRNTIEPSQYQSNYKVDDFSDTLKAYNSNTQNDLSIDEDLTFYGYEYFSKSKDRILWDNQPPLSRYVIGPGDELIIEVWGDTQLRSKHVVDKYGKINIDKIGQVYITGTHFQDIRQKLIKNFSNVYSTLKGKNPTSFLDISLGKLKSINITFMGEVNHPGIYPIHPFSTIVTSLMQVGGVDNTGSLRDIQVIRNGEVIANFDFYNYLNTKGIKGDARLLDGDIVFLPVRYSAIRCFGNILKPGIYEILPNETLSEIIEYIGGFRSDSKTTLRVHRLSKFSVPAKTFLLNSDLDSQFILNDGDELEAFEIESNDHIVFLYGQIKNPGEYAFDTESETKLLDIITLAGILDDETYLQTIYKDVGEIIRNHPDTDYPEILQFNLDKLIEGDVKQNIILKNWDIILIRENPNYKFPSKVTVLGEVNVPGIYTLQKKWESLNDILDRAGGFTTQAFHDGIQLYRNQNQVALNNFDIVLSDGDSLIVPKHPGVVKIRGEVNRPGLIQYDIKKNINNYIESAGGFTVNADEYNITVIYANGDVRIKKKFKKPHIGEGSTIIVHKKIPNEPFSLTEFSTNIASIITSFATLVLLINQVY